MNSKEETKRYGGRALRNGVMMVGPKSVAVAVRRPDGKIVTSIEPFSMPGSWSRSIPFVRGLVAFAGMVKLAKVSTRLEGKLNLGGSKWKANLTQLAPGAAAMIADRLAHQISRGANRRIVAPIQAVAGITLPFAAFGVSGRLPEVRELWRYHGAEHKAVHTAEAGLDLTPQNATSMSRVHPRCGTVLAFWGMVGGTLAKMHVESLPEGKRKAWTALAIGPVVLATAYELARLGAQLKDHPIGKAVFSPVWNTQLLTTAEPDSEELEVACAALQAVIDYEQALA
jgi:uncharacterized protein YqhQ